MNVEIFLDCTEAPAENISKIDHVFRHWYMKGTKQKPNKTRFVKLTPLAQPNCYLIDLGYADPISSFCNLHTRLQNLGVNIFLNFNDTT